MPKKSNKAKGDEYEKLVGEILMNPQIHWGREGVTFDKKSSEKKVAIAEGRAYQIDVHLLSSTSEKHHIICECKNYSRPINQGTANSFVTVIRDIHKSHSDWKIVPVLASASGFQKGAEKALLANRISALHMMDLREKTRKTSISESIISPNITITKVFLSDGSEVSPKETFVNYQRGDFYYARNAIGYFEWFDEGNQPIHDLVHHQGNFHTGQRVNLDGAKDKFLFRKDETKELGRIEGFIQGPPTEYEGGAATQISKPWKARLKLENGDVYIFFQDGSVKRIKSSS